MRLLAENPGQSGAQLARQCGVAAQNVRDHLQNLVIEGHLASIPNPCRKGQRLYYLREEHHGQKENRSGA